jgi:ubiquinone/menaquinone biosynthesis C-methylase UbiE
MKGGVKEYWSKRVTRYRCNRQNDLNTRTLQGLLEKNMDSYKPTKVLEIGCGPGIFTQLLSNKTRVVALDISKDMLKFVKKRGIQAELLQADMDYLPFKLNSFDFIVAYRVMEYSKNPIKTLNAISRVAPTVSLQFPRHDSIKGFLLWVYRNVLTTFGPSPSFRSYTLKGAARLGEKAGFEIKSVIPYNNGYDMQMVMQTKTDLKVKEQKIVNC